MYSLGLVLAKHLCHIISDKRFCERGNPGGRPKKKFLKTGFNKFMIIQHPQAHFYVSF